MLTYYRDKSSSRMGGVYFFVKTMTKQESGITITIRSLMNGFTVDGHPAGNHPMEEDVSYVYKTIDKVAKELPGIYSVLSEDSKPKTEKDLDNLEKEANEAGKE